MYDFNTIVNGPNIYDPLRFASVSLDNDYTGLLPIDPQHPPTGATLAKLNRYLLNDAYNEYQYGMLGAATALGLANYSGGDDSGLTAQLLGDLDLLSRDPVLWNTPPHNYSLYSEQRFLGIAFRSGTQTLILQLLATPPLSATDTVLLNRMLLEDGLAISGVLNYSSGLVAPATVAALQAFAQTPSGPNRAALEPLLVDDLNKVLDSGAYTRSALESAFPQITRSKTRAAYTLIDVPASTTLVSAKTAWNLRVTLAPVGSLPDAMANFVNGGNHPAGTWVFDPANDNYLRGGDITGDNRVSLSDYNILVANWLTTNAVADINGDGKVNIRDFNLFQSTFNGANQQGDSDVNVAP